MPTEYPDGIDAFTRPVEGEPRSSGTEEVEVIENLMDAVEATETELGVNPAGAYPSVKDRLDALTINIDGGAADSVYGGVLTIDGGNA